MNVIDLGGKWNLTKSDNTINIVANVPGDVYADLLREKQIEDPYFRNNEESLQWIGESDWIFTRTFNLDESFFRNEKIILHCDGLDTFSKVIINDSIIAKTDNMFRTYEWDVKNILSEGKNSIEIYFTSTIPYAKEKQAERPIHCWGTFNGYDDKWILHKPHKVDITHGWIRKEQCNYGWDWGLMAVTCGIWRDIKLLGINTARIDNLYIRQTHNKNSVQLSIDINLETLSSEIQTNAKLTITHKGKTFYKENLKITGNNKNIILDIDNPNLWWPAGMGKQPLYTVNIELFDVDNNKLDSSSKNIGLRTIELVRENDEYGESFYFKVNGISFFAKGANWIPADGILANLPASRYYTLLEDAVKANMNMIRLWGGGIYEHDIFYDICDELGLVVWQDFMFACSTYPTFDDKFMDTVEHELIDNIKRIRHHACIGLYCGNNELEQRLVGEEWSETTMSWKDYSRLFDKLMPKIVNELDPDTDYWPSSPHTPIGDRYEFNDPNSGDSHLWDVWHGKKPFEWFRTCTQRFISEFGFQSFTEPKVTDSFTIKEDRNITSYVMEHHQRSDIGNSTIMHYMLDWFKMPLGFDNTLWVSQILQALAIKYAVEHWRRNMHRTMGAIYWQLNDTWPGPSWSSIDYYCNWKALHYEAKRFFSPMLISGVENLKNNKVDIHITNDLMEIIPVAAEVKVTDLKGNYILDETFYGETTPQGNIKIATIDLNSALDELKDRDILVWMDLIAYDKVVSTNLVTLAKPKHMTLIKPDIEHDIKQINKNEYIVSISSKSPALWCWLELTETKTNMSDNFFHIRPDKKYKVTVSLDKSISIDEFKNKLIVRSLYNTY